MAELDKLAQAEIERLTDELDAQTTLNTILEAENIELREENTVLRRAIRLERQNRQLADHLVA